MKQTVILIILLFSAAPPAQESEALSYEQELVAQLAGSYPPGEVVWLHAMHKPFLALYKEPDGIRAGKAAVILHSMGGHADWPELIAPLRINLPGKGWATLSVQLPVLAPQAAFAEYGTLFIPARARIQSALRYLQKLGYADIVLIGYSFGASTAVDFLSGSATPVRAFAGISMQKHVFLNPSFDLVERLSGVAVPVLDVYGGGDFSDVVDSADDRRLAGNKSGSPYQQIIIRAANHYYTGMEQELIERLAVWLAAVVPDPMPLASEQRYSQ
jgi:pimeloyl-ACP methyl ester carboxylesterase